MNALVGSGRHNGLGWTLTLLDTLLHEYGGYTLKTVRHLLLAEAFALYAAIAARYDHAPAGPTYEEAAMLAELDQAAARQPNPDPAWQA